MTDKPKCKHGVILYGTHCINCKRERQEAEKKKQLENAVVKRVEKLDW